MPRPRSGSELESLRAQAADLEKKIKEVAARDRARQARDDHRRWVISGSAALDHMRANPQDSFAATLLSLINDRARSAADRALFNLSPAKTSENM